MPTDYFKGLFLYNAEANKRNYFRILSNTNGLNPSIRVEGEIKPGTDDWEVGDLVQVVLPIGIPSTIGASTDNTEGNISLYNLVGGAYGVERELTIGNQLISMDLRGIDRRDNIPSKIVI